MVITTEKSVKHNSNIVLITIWAVATPSGDEKHYCGFIRFTSEYNTMQFNVHTVHIRRIRRKNQQ
jgi:hypothetical protein